MKTIALPLRHNLKQLLDEATQAGKLSADNAALAIKTLRRAYTITECNSDGTEKKPKQVLPQIEINTDDEKIAADIQAIADKHDPDVSDEEREQEEIEEGQTLEQVKKIRKALIRLLDDEEIAAKIKKKAKEEK